MRRSASVELTLAGTGRPPRPVVVNGDSGPWSAANEAFFLMGEDAAKLDCGKSPLGRDMKVA